MNPVLAQWVPVMVMLLAIWFGLIYNIKRLDDFKDLLKAEVQGSKDSLKSDLRASEERIMRAIERTESNLRADIARLEHRVERLEAPMVRPS